MKARCCECSLIREVNYVRRCTECTNRICATVANASGDVRINGVAHSRAENGDWMIAAHELYRIAYESES